jgi:hypothetical protein
VATGQSAQSAPLGLSLAVFREREEAQTGIFVAGGFLREAATL